MRTVKGVIAAAIVIGLMIVAFQAYSIFSASTAPSTQSNQSFAPSPGDISYPNPLNPNVTLVGTMTSLSVAPVCSLSNPPCAISNHPLYYITVNGVDYRLVFPNSTKLPQNNARISVTGVFVTPSTYQASQWTPQMYFRGDIYVTSYTYVSPYI